MLPLQDLASTQLHDLLVHTGHLVAALQLQIQLWMDVHWVSYYC